MRRVGGIHRSNNAERLDYASGTWQIAFRAVKGASLAGKLGSLFVGNGTQEAAIARARRILSKKWGISSGQLNIVTTKFHPRTSDNSEWFAHVVYDEVNEEVESNEAKIAFADSWLLLEEPTKGDVVTFAAVDLVIGTGTRLDGSTRYNIKILTHNTPNQIGSIDIEIPHMDTANPTRLFGYQLDGDFETVASVQRQLKVLFPWIGEIEPVNIEGFPDEFMEEPDGE
jgi:hypothetical protein